ncbi:DNA-binding NarL/FixJ family response regulator [Microbacterium sp. AG790]|uniref:helix-turn-helix transcriptional regulator n=1 Tax=Microbacterium sp. AG790 TaxID=2183995 RepID=UPI000EAFD201|nr:response regulator transcription factor [Microbacterium sp. AG790]RKS90258.1 DNA-binding NarL/FixJ family response regulator [Microbacterium sp. AG790]
MTASGGAALRRLTIVDPSRARRAHARELLAGRLGMRVVAEAATLGEIVVRPAAGVSASQLLFLVVTDGVEPELSALAAYRCVGMRVVALTAGASDHVVRALMDAGVEGIVSSRESEGVVLAVVDAVRRGARAWSPHTRAKLDALAVRPALSAQETRLVALYAAGYTISEVADRLGVRGDTARKYLNRVKAKYAAVGRPVHTKAELAQAAREDGLLPPGASAAHDH